MRDDIKVSKISVERSVQGDDGETTSVRYECVLDAPVSLQEADEITVLVSMRVSLQALQNAVRSGSQFSQDRLQEIRHQFKEKLESIARGDRSWRRR